MVNPSLIQNNEPRLVVSLTGYAVNKGDNTFTWPSRYGSLYTVSVPRNLVIQVRSVRNKTVFGAFFSKKYGCLNDRFRTICRFRIVPGEHWRGIWWTASPYLKMPDKLDALWWLILSAVSIYSVCTLSGKPLMHPPSKLAVEWSRRISTQLKTVLHVAWTRSVVWGGVSP